MLVSQVAIVVKNLPANSGDVRDMGLVPGLERSSGEGQDKPFQSFCLENPMDRGAWQAMAHRVTKRDMTEATQHAGTWFSEYNFSRERKKNNKSSPLEMFSIPGKVNHTQTMG